MRADRIGRVALVGLMMTLAVRPGSGAGGPDGPEGPSAPGPGACLGRLNRMTPEELGAVPGIGPGLAGRIVAARTLAGAFSGLEELTGVPGIGPVRARAVMTHLGLDPAAMDRLLAWPVPDGRLARPRSFTAGSAAGWNRPGEVPDLNVAAFEDLARVRGIGRTLARRIVDERTRNGDFNHIEDLYHVDGITPAILHHIAGRFRVPRPPGDPCRDAIPGVRSAQLPDGSRGECR